MVGGVPAAEACAGPAAPPSRGGRLVDLGAQAVAQGPEGIDPGAGGRVAGPRRRAGRARSARRARRPALPPAPARPPPARASSGAPGTGRRAGPASSPRPASSWPAPGRAAPGPVASREAAPPPARPRRAALRSAGVRARAPDREVGQEAAPRRLRLVHRRQVFGRRLGDRLGGDLHGLGGSVVQGAHQQLAVEVDLQVLLVDRRQGVVVGGAVRVGQGFRFRRREAAASSTGASAGASPARRPPAAPRSYRPPSPWTW